MKNSTPEIKIIKQNIKPVIKKNLNDSSVLFDQETEKTFQSYYIDTLYLNSNEDVEKETEFMTEEDINDFVLNYKQVTTIGPKLNMIINNIEIGHDTSEIYELHLNIMSEPSDSLLNKRKQQKDKNYFNLSKANIIFSSSEEENDISDNQIIIDKALNNNIAGIHLTDIKTTQLDSLKKKEGMKEKEIGTNIKKTQGCNGLCKIF